MKPQASEDSRIDAVIVPSTIWRFLNSLQCGHRHSTLGLRLYRGYLLLHFSFRFTVAMSMFTCLLVTGNSWFLVVIVCIILVGFIWLGRSR